MALSAPGFRDCCLNVIDTKQFLFNTQLLWKIICSGTALNLFNCFSLRNIMDLCLYIPPPSITVELSSSTYRISAIKRNIVQPRKQQEKSVWEQLNTGWENHWSQTVKRETWECKLPRGNAEVQEKFRKYEYKHHKRMKNRIASVVIC